MARYLPLPWVMFGKTQKSPDEMGEVAMWMEITRGVAALKSAWGFGPTAMAVETGTTTDLTGDFLAEAQSYMNMGRHQSAAILAGDALEATLQRLCRDYCVALPMRPTVEGMNQKLVEAGIYNNHVEQQVEELRTLWEKANSGLWSEVTKLAVENMMNQIRAFIGMHVAQPVAN
jgi:hypothetical protein